MRAVGVLLLQASDPHGKPLGAPPRTARSRLLAVPCRGPPAQRERADDDCQDDEREGEPDHFVVATLSRTWEPTPSTGGESPCVDNVSIVLLI